MLAILDYEAGNQTSVQRGLSFSNIPSTITADPVVLENADGVIFPGVGAAGQAMAMLERSGLASTLKHLISTGKPLLGVCLGCQILLEHSEENDTKGLGIVEGSCHRFDTALCEEDGTPLCIPHMGWNSLTQKKQSRLLDGIPDNAEFYFVHSYYVAPEEHMVIATTSYGREFCSIYGRDGLWAVQFHAEKSGKHGLTLLNNFYQYCLEVKK